MLNIEIARHYYISKIPHSIKIIEQLNPIMKGKLDIWGFVGWYDQNSI